MINRLTNVGNVCVEILHLKKLKCSYIYAVCRAVDAVCREGPERVMELVELGAQFTRGAAGQLHLTRGA